MLHFMRTFSSAVIAVGSGVAIGVSVTLLYQKVPSSVEEKLQRLVAEIAALRREVEALKTIIENSLSKKKKRLSEYYSIHGSSGDEDDEEFLEAFEEAEFEVKAAPTLPKERPPPSYIPNGEPIADAGELYQKVDKLMDGGDNDVSQAYGLLHTREHELGRDVNFMWRYARATYMRASLLTPEEKKEDMYRAHDYAAKAILMDDDNASVHKWFAITVAGVGDYEGTQVKLQNGFKFKDHIQRAIQLNPNDPASYYLLGRWQYAIYSLSWLERQAAARVFGANLSADVDDALQNFMEAERIKPGDWKENVLHIAKCHIEKRDYSTAVTWLDKAKEIAVVSQGDRDAEKEIENYLYKYSGYRS